jgi:hypothetical protein
MDAIQFVAVYIGIIALFLFIMLFGEMQCFESTIVAKAHVLLTGGACQLGAAGVTRCFGERGRRVMDATATQCCERSNPALQVRRARRAAPHRRVCRRSCVPR